MSLIKNISIIELEKCKTAGSFLQSAVWGEFKSRFGWKAHSFLIETEGKGSEQDLPGTPLLVLSRRIAPGFSFAYVPWGPELPPDFPQNERAPFLSELALKLKPFLPRTAVFIRFDLPWINFDSNTLFTVHCPLIKKAAVDVQAPDTVIIDLEKSCEEILANMKTKWRYNISLAAKKGVKVNEQCTMNNEQLETFYSLLKETAARDGIAIHSFDYYKILFELYAAKGADSGGVDSGGADNEKADSKKAVSEKADLRLYSAIHEGDTLAAIAVLFRGKWATYLYGASANLKRNLMAPYALQWKAMQDAKEAGCQYYDLFGIPPDENPNHPMAGLYRFKTGFGGQIVHRPGCRDYPYKPFFYSLFSFAERLRKKFITRRA